MKHQSPQISATVRRALYLVALAALLVAALASAGCDNQDGNKDGTGNRPQGNINTSPSPQPTKPLTGSDDPVVITGGSVDLNFDERAYLVDPADENKFTCTDCTVTGPVEITPTGGTMTTCTVPQSGDYTITMDGGGAKKNITISVIGNTVVITADKKEYGPCEPGQKHCNKTNKVKGVKIKPAVGAETNCSGVPSNGKCKVRIPVHKNS